MDSIFTEIMKTVGAQTIIDMLKEAWGQCSSYIRADRNVEVLKSKMEELSKLGEDVMTELQGKEVDQGKKRKREVELWLQNVKKAKDDVQSIEDGIENRSWISLSRYRSAMLLERKIEYIVELQKKGEFPNGLVVDPMTEIGMDLPSSSLIGQTTAHKTLETIWNCLMDVKIGKIGVHGMGGVGKTTIMKHINNRLGTDPHFDNVIWVTVSKDLNLERLQNDIAKAIELRFSEDEDELRRSKAVCAKLKGRKKFLLILDDMWEAFPLERIGIPEPNQSNGYKVVFTTRDLGVCQRMESDVDIKVEVLSNEEAWDLFKDKVGRDAVLSSNLQDVAKLVVQECGRLPLAIITVGRALRKKNDVREWENALYELRGSSSEIKDMDAIVFKSLRFSYDRLRNDKVRACFLYCALYPEDFVIPREELIEYWMGEGLIEEKGNRATILNKGHAVLNELSDACMLESVLRYDHFECVKMHDLLRDMAISITRLNRHFVVKAGNTLEDSLKEDELVEDVERISLMKTNIKSLRGQPNCPKLSTLFLQNNYLLRSVPDSFFHHMKGLRVLNLSNSSIESLPESVTELENLRSLILQWCGSLQKVPSLRKLKALRVLDLSWTKIEELPHGMEEMISLRRLDLSQTKNLRTFQAGILANLSSLEDLDMCGSNWKWSSYSAGNVTAVSEELMSLTRLTSIRLHFSDLSSSVGSMKLPKLENFFFRIGDSVMYDILPKRHHRVLLPAGYFSCRVEIFGCNTIIQDGSFCLPDKTQYLHFAKCNMSGLSKLPCLSNAKELKECRVSYCDGLKYILAANDGATVLSSLETMYLSDLRNLRALCSGVVSSPSLTNLKTLVVSRCNGLRNLISFKLLQHLRNLEHVDVSYCRMMKEIIAKEDMRETNIIIALPCLKILVLTSLHELKTIYTGTLIWSSLVDITVEECPHLKIPPFSSHNLAIRKIDVRGNHNIEELFPEENDENPITLRCLEEMILKRLPALKRISTRPFICESLRTISLCNCPWLKKLPLSVHNLPPTLECIKVSDCASLEEIIAGEDQDESKNIVLPKLKYLTLRKLSELKRICRQSLICNSLENIQVSKCPRLKKLPLSVHNLPPTLECIKVSDCASLEEITAGEDQDESKIVLSKLKTLWLADLPELKRICRQSLICSSLETIRVGKCPQLRKLLSIDNPKSNPHYGSVIEGSAEWWGALEWDDPNTKTLLHPHFREEEEE